MHALYSLRALGLFIAVPVVVIAVASQLKIFDTDGDNRIIIDSDQDRFSDTLEEYVGTDPLDGCADDLSDSAWPPDLDNDGLVTDSDVDAIAEDMGNSVPPALKRKDIAPDPPDGIVDIADVGTIRGFLGTGC